MSTLTLQQQLFVAEYCRNGFNATAAYRVAYNPPATMVAHRVSKAAADVRHGKAVTEEIERVLAETRNAVVFEKTQALRAWLDIATADPNELISLRIGCCRYCYGDGNAYQWREREFLEACDKAERDQAMLTARNKHLEAAAVRLPDIGGGFGFNATLSPNPECPECHGEGVQRVVPQDTTNLSPDAKRLYGGVKITKDGFQIIMADRMKALENACRVAGIMTDNVKVQGQLAVMAAVAQLTTTDPNEAMRQYQEMIANGGMAA